MPTGFHPNPHFFSAHLELTVELLRFLAVPQFPLVPFTTVRTDKRNLLEARVIVTTYNDHVRLLSPEPWLVSATKVYSGMGADIVMESLHSSYERGCQEKKLLPAPGEDAGVVTYIQPHLILRGVIGLAALARRTF